MITTGRIMVNHQEPQEKVYKTALKRILQQAITYDFQNVIDIGSGTGFAALAFNNAGKEVTATDLHPDLFANLPLGVKLYEQLDICNMSSLIPSESYDAVWCSHVLEHVMNTELALSEIRRILKPNGILFLTVPPFEHRVLGGHVCPGWNVGILMYILIICGFDVANGSFINYHHNVSAFVRKGEDFTVPIIHDNGDIEAIRHLFPASLDIYQGFNGQIDNYNWDWKVPSISLDKEAAIKSNKLQNREKFFQFIPPILVKTYYDMKSSAKA
jgi:2-polyprenyl-3-methyl-5-hydroxy-6-metoxy-1,4-benzoquinol methylase